MSTYPTVSKGEAARFVSQRFAGAVDVDLQTSFSPSPTGTDFRDQIDDTLDVVLEEFHYNKDSYSHRELDALEGKLCNVLYEGFRNLPGAVLSDRDFWRHSACRLYDFVVWRQRSTTAHALLPYFGAASGGIGRDCVPHRMFARALIVDRGTPLPADDPERMSLAELGAADAWKSHVFRVSHGNAPLVAWRMMEGVRQGDLPTEVIRKLAKDLQRVRANVVFEVLDVGQVEALMRRELGTAAAGDGATAWT